MIEFRLTSEDGMKPVSGATRAMLMSVDAGGKCHTGLLVEGKVGFNDIAELFIGVLLLLKGLPEHNPEHNPEHGQGVYDLVLEKMRDGGYTSELAFVERKEEP